MVFKDLIPWSRERALGPARRREDPLWSLQRDMNRLFSDFAQDLEVAPFADWESGRFRPSFDVRETDDEVLVSAELPGLEEKDFELTIAEGVLVLKGEKRGEHTGKKRGAVIHRERIYGAFERELVLPCEVEADKAEARYQNGVLRVRLPKAASARASARRIEVKSG